MRRAFIIFVCAAGAAIETYDYCTTQDIIKIPIIILFCIYGGIKIAEKPRQEYSPFDISDMD